MSETIRFLPLRNDTQLSSGIYVHYAYPIQQFVHQATEL